MANDKVKEEYAIPEHMVETVAMNEKLLAQYDADMKESIAKREDALAQLAKATGVDIEVLRLI